MTSAAANPAHPPKRPGGSARVLAATRRPEPEDSDPGDSSSQAVAGNLLYTASPSGLLIYNIGPPAGIPLTAQVTIPTNNGVSIAPNSFSLAPTTITTGADSETLVWEAGFAPGMTSQTITWQSNITGLQPGQAVTVAQDATVAFNSQGTPGMLTLPNQVVTGDQIIGMSAVSGNASANADSGQIEC